MSHRDFTCVIPAFNEADRIGSVLNAVIGHPLIGDVIVVDDGSTDDTAAVAKAKGARVVKTPGNLGKTKALMHGFEHVTTSHIVLIDADLIGLTPGAVTSLIDPVRQGSAFASISLRGNAPRSWRMIGIDYISGERVILHSLLAGHGETIASLPRFGFEVFLNQLLIAQRAPVAIIKWPDVASPSKASKRGFMVGLFSDLEMLGDIFRTISPIECMRQILDLRRLS